MLKFFDLLNKLFESKIDEASRLDISIKTADSFVKTNGYEQLLNKTVSIESKTDGVKITVVKIANSGTSKDYVIAYKGSILFSSGFNYAKDDDIRANSIGASQFKFLLKHFAELPANDIPIGTEFQIEYLMNKPTLSSKYSRPYGMVLVGYSKSKFAVRHGILSTKNTGMHTAKRDEYARILQIDVPLKLFKGKMNTFNNFKKGILYKPLLDIFLNAHVDFSTPENTYNGLKDVLLKVPSVYGGTEEGVVLKTKTEILKMQQSYQLDQDARTANKNKFRSSREEEDAYWKEVISVAQDYAKHIVLSDDLDEVMENISAYVLNNPHHIEHEKKNYLQITDDLVLTIKNIVLKRVKGNDGCLILGKFRVITNGHYKLVQDALAKFDRVAICLVTGKDTANTYDLRLRMLKSVFGRKVTIVTASTGNLTRVISSIPFNINHVYAGTDRVDTYKKQLEKTLGVDVLEMPRTDDDISATKVIANIADEDYFKKNTPRKLYKFYDELVQTYGN